MPKWCVAAGICGVTFTCVLLLRSAYEGSQSATIVHTPITAWCIIVNQQVNMNKKLTVTRADRGVFSIQISDTLSACSFIYTGRAIHKNNRSIYTIHKTINTCKFHNISLPGQDIAQKPLIVLCTAQCASVNEVQNCLGISSR